MAPDTSPPADQPRDRVHHTLTACVRCRSRKTRCDATLPRCLPCERSNQPHCEYFDAAKGVVVSRNYIVNLQESVRKLQAQLKTLEQNDDYEPDHESMARAPGLVRFRESDESRFLGPSSGIATTRFVMDFARRNAGRKTIKDIVNDQTAREVKQVNDAESAKPTSKVYPLISSVAAESLPNKGLMDQLLTIFECKAQYMLPLLHEPSFRQSVDMVYEGSQDAVLNFQVRIVIAIALQKLDIQYAGLADSYYLAALPYLSDSIKRKSIETLQCFALMGSYSLLTPTRTAAYWVIGMAAKLCQDLGLCNEETIDKPPTGTRPTFLEIDMRRRLFWIITSMEYGLSHSLGRPSAFGVGVENINVGFFQLCDDKYITPEGLLPGHHPIMKKCISIHFLKMRLLQAEIRRKLYLRKRESPMSDQDPWFRDMIEKIDYWTRNTPKNDEGSGLSPAWFEGRKNTMIVFMYRPSPQIPHPSAFAAEQCYGAAAFNIGLQKKQVEGRLIDITWIFTQAIFMAINTVLWSISYPEVRERHPVEEVRQYLANGLEAIILCADRWPGVNSAHQLYENLVSACLKAYEPQSVPQTLDPAKSVLNHDSANQSAPSSAQSPISASAGSYQGPQSPQSYTSFPSLISSGQASGHNIPERDVFGDQTQNGNLHISTSYPMQNYSHYSATSPSELSQSLTYSSPEFAIAANMQYPANSQSLPDWDTLNASNFGIGGGLPAEMQLDQPPWLASFGGDYPQAQQGAEMMPYQMQSLTQQQQLDLMASLERDELPDVSRMISDSTTFYTAGLP